MEEVRDRAPLRTTLSIPFIETASFLGSGGTRQETHSTLAEYLDGLPGL